MDFPRPNFRGSFLGGYNKSDAEDRRNELIRSFDKIRSQAQEDLNAKKAGESHPSGTG